MTTTTALTLVGKKGVKLPDIITTALAVPEHRTVLPDEYDIPVPVRADQNTVLALQATTVLEPITVTERRILEQTEIDALNEERVQLDAMEKYIAARKAAHRAMIFNHLDVEIENSSEDVPEADDKGHYILPGEVFTTGGHRFTRELRKGSPELSAESLRAVEEEFDDAVFSHEDYLAMTTPVRVLDEEKTLILLRTKPELVEVLARASKPGKTTASLYRRK
jgi:hypothetical protein